MSYQRSAAARLDYVEQSRVAECEQLREEIDQLRDALVTRDTIGQAKGIIRLAFACDEDAAFAALARISQDANRKLRDVAVLVIDSAVGHRSLPPDFAVSVRRSMEQGAGRS